MVVVGVDVRPGGRGESKGVCDGGGGEAGEDMSEMFDLVFGRFVRVRVERATDSKG